MFLALRESLFLEKVMKDILWRELQTLKYGFLINDTIELLLIILGMILWSCRRMPLFLGYVCCSLLRWITMSANYFKHMWIGLAHIKSLFSWVKNKGRPMPVVQPNSCWKRERERKQMRWQWGFQMKNIKIFVLFFQIFMCLKFFKIKSWEKIGSQYIKVNSQQIHVC